MVGTSPKGSVRDLIFIIKEDKHSGGNMKAMKVFVAPSRQMSRQMRRNFFTGFAYNLAKKQMPKMSETEKVALGAGTVGFDRDIFGGSPSLKHLVDTYACKLTAEEQSFLDNEVETLCTMLDDHKVTMEKDMSPGVGLHARQGLLRDEDPQGVGRQGVLYAHVSSVLAKLGSHCFDANATVAVPNSLGPGELLVRYGTDEQRGYFLPRLANGTSSRALG